MGARDLSKESGWPGRVFTLEHMCSSAVEGCGTCMYTHTHAYTGVLLSSKTDTKTEENLVTLSLGELVILVGRNKS